nr:hypothetical protein [Gammaproteobacteria bacterium]
WNSILSRPAPQLAHAGTHSKVATSDCRGHSRRHQCGCPMAPSAWLLLKKSLSCFTITIS